MDENKQLSCLNCNASLPSDSSFCNHCGQAKLESRLNILQLLKDFISNIFNLDGRIFRSIKHVWKPAFLATEYISGKRKSYVNPIRFFLVMLVLLFFILNNIMNTEEFDQGTIQAISKVEQKKLAAIYDSTICQIAPDISQRMERDLRDTIFGDTETLSPRIWVGGNFLGWKIREYSVTRDDAYAMPIDSLFDKYELTEWYDQLFIKQLIKVDKNRSGSAAYFISKLLWGVILSIVLIALLFKLLYIRQLYYYVEHLIVIILFSAKMLLLINLMLLIQLSQLEFLYQNYIGIALYLFVLLYLILTLKKYYRQSIWKTIIKTFIIIMGSLYIFFTSVLIVSVISLALM